MISNAEQILVVFLSTALAVFLILAIVIAVQIIRLLNVLQIIADKAERFAESAEAMGDMVRKTVGGLSLVKFINNIVDLVKHKQTDKGDDTK